MHGPECAKDAHSCGLHMRLSFVLCCLVVVVQLPPGIVLAWVLAGLWLCCGTGWGVASACCAKFTPELYLRSHSELCGLSCAH